MKYLFVMLLVGLNTLLNAAVIKIPETSPGTGPIKRMQTGFDYDGDKSVEIITWEEKGYSNYVGLFSAKKEELIFISLVDTKEQKVISGDFSGNGQMDIAIDRQVICFEKGESVIQKSSALEKIKAQLLTQVVRTNPKVQISLFKSTDVSISMYTIAGKLIHVQKDKKLPKGDHKLELNVQQMSLANGKYIIEVSTPDYAMYELITLLH